MSVSHIFPRINTTDMNVLIVCISAMIFIVFLAFVVYCTWKPNPNDTGVDITPGSDNHARESRPRENLARENLAAVPFDGSTTTRRVEIYSDAVRRDSDTGCRLPFFQRRRETSLERNTIPLQSVPGRQHPRNDAD
ncbi:hypothetical protein FLAG1_04329 [Fusarium langsethiae]|uniref:Uncharacterized protein n=1 Tax=Fusarium langsethiae TaxID=179993 RepID=A0A0M9EZM8_FUSLA|nr:hypothetical protein FLAG1_04329 [Fusarium langsethiae]GKU02105.1 unnamed protein product [Fusarium langsethiae]